MSRPRAHDNCRLTLTFQLACEHAESLRVRVHGLGEADIEHERAAVVYHYDFASAPNPIELEVTFDDPRLGFEQFMQSFRLDADGHPEASEWHPRIEVDHARGGGAAAHTYLTIDLQWIDSTHLEVIDTYSWLPNRSGFPQDALYDDTDPGRPSIKPGPFGGCRVLCLSFAGALSRDPAHRHLIGTANICAAIPPTVDASTTIVDVVYFAGRSHDAVHPRALLGTLFNRRERIGWYAKAADGHFVPSVPCAGLAEQLAASGKQAVALFTIFESEGYALPSHSVLRALAAALATPATSRAGLHPRVEPGNAALVTVRDAIDVERFLDIHPDVADVWCISPSAAQTEHCVQKMMARGGRLRITSHADHSAITSAATRAGLPAPSEDALSIPASPPAITCWPASETFFTRSQAMERLLTPFEQARGRLLGEMSEARVAELHTLAGETTAELSTPFSSRYGVYRMSVPASDHSGANSAPLRLVFVLDNGRPSPVYEVHGIHEMALSAWAFGRTTTPRAQSVEEVERGLDDILAALIELNWPLIGWQTIADTPADHFENVTGYFEAFLRFSQLRAGANGARVPLIRPEVPDLPPPANTGARRFLRSHAVQPQEDVWFRRC